MRSLSDIRKRTRVVVIIINVNNVFKCAVFIMKNIPKVENLFKTDANSLMTIKWHQP